MSLTVIGILRGLLGIAILVGISAILSTNRKRIHWPLVLSGILLQFFLAFLLLKVPGIRGAFQHVAGFFIHIMNFTMVGSEFLFGSLVSDTKSFGFIFAFQVIPTIVFFSAFTSILYYLNILQWVVYGFAWVMKRTMKLSGAESLAAAANIFVGQTEAPLVVKPYLEKMTRSEMLALMTGGMATIAGGVFVLYIGMLGGDDPIEKQRFATHLLLASIMSAPAALLIAKMLVPETETVDQQLLVPRHEVGSNLLDAITNGTTQGVKLAVNVAAMLLVFIALIAMLNYMLQHWVGTWTGLNEAVAGSSAGRYDGLSLQYVLGLLLAPIAWVMGVPSGDLMLIGQLLGEKTIMNELVAYASFSEMKHAGVITNHKSIIIATYALCGFANFSSIGIQIGGISVIAPCQRRTLCELGFQALVAGTIACLITACIAGMIVG